MTPAPRRKTFGLIMIVVLVVAVWLGVMIWIALQPQPDDGSLGIDDEDTYGGAAITSVLEDQGIAVRPAQSMTQLRSELDRDPDATVLVHDKNLAMEYASYQRLEELAELVPADQRVFAGVNDQQLDHMVDGVEMTQPVPGFAEELTVEDTCNLDAALEAGTIEEIRESVLLDDSAEGCFAIEEDPTGEQVSYAFAQTADGSIIFADWMMLSNAGLYENGTATLATWSLGQTATVIWFQPDFTFDPDDDGDLSPVQLPDWARMGIVWAVIVTFLALLYLGRRTGPVITEPLPAEVSAAETTVGRGRMYAKGKHHRHALANLQDASLARLARLLQLGPGTSKDAILAETATQLGENRQQLHQLYHPPTGALTAKDFVNWAQQLQQLEQRVRDRFTAPTKESS